MSRFIKQIIYGVFYLAILAGIVYAAYWLAVGLKPSCFDNRLNQGEEDVDCGGSCLPCELKNLQPLRTQVQIFGVDGGTSALITIANPNLNYGARSFVYKLNFYNASKQQIFSLSKESFIYPAEAQKFILEPNLKVNFATTFGDPELILENFDWRPVEEFSEPKTQIRQTTTEISGRQIIVNGLLSNRESFSLSRAGVGVLVYQNLPNGETALIGISKTVLQDLKPFEERSFKIIVPVAEILKLSDIDTVIVTEALR